MDRGEELLKDLLTYRQHEAFYTQPPVDWNATKRRKEAKEVVSAELQRLREEGQEKKARQVEEAFEEVTELVPEVEVSDVSDFDLHDSDRASPERR